jgi:hypothetical protein
LWSGIVKGKYRGTFEQENSKNNFLNQKSLGSSISSTSSSSSSHIPQIMLANSKLPPKYHNSNANHHINKQHSLDQPCSTNSPSTSPNVSKSNSSSSFKQRLGLSNINANANTNGVRTYRKTQSAGYGRGSKITKNDQ